MGSNESKTPTPASSRTKLMTLQTTEPARFLLGEARAKGERAGTGLRVELTQTNQQIAARIGFVREVVSRALTRLQHDGLITLEGRHLIIPDEKALSAYVGE